MFAYRCRSLFHRYQLLHSSHYATIAATLILLGLLLTGCIATTPVAPGTSAETAAPTALPATTQSGAVVIAHERGELTFTDVPQRIIALEYSYMDALIALDVAPVGYADDGVPAYLLNHLQGTDAVAVGARNEPNLELISQLQPDLIIADVTRHSEIYDHLNAIAPTLIFDSYRGSYDNQIAIFEALSRVLDKEEQAAAAVQAARAALDEARRVSAAHERSIIVGVLAANGFWVHTTESFKGSLLAALHLPTTVEPLEGQTQFVMDLEGIAAVNPAAIVVTCAPEDRALWEEWSSQPVWQQLDAVQNHQVYVFNRDLWSKSRGILSLHLVLRDMHESGLLAGEPSRSTTCPDPVIE
ncbi:MAG TPA: ABC transporter substrate-binding protein [Caldilineaceae bacterium]|nr:ABC transporter substrate-binding protein [Caldilineaceae bacterium]